MKALTAVFMALLLSGCQTIPEKVLVPVSVPCRVVKPKEPKWATAGLKADASIWEKVQALLAERRQRIAYEAVLNAAIESCNESADAIGSFQ